MKLIDKVAALPQDFTVDEEMAVDRDAVGYPRDRAEARDAGGSGSSTICC